MSSKPRSSIESSDHRGPLTESAGLAETDVDDVIETCMKRLLQNGPVTDPTDLRTMLPNADDELRQFVLIELIKLDMALTAEQQTPRRIEVYVQAIPDLLSAESIPLDLVMEEIQLRKERGETPSRDEYATRFPRFESMFGHLVDLKEVTAAVKQMGRPPDLETGSQIDDFQIVQKLGQGAFAHVYLAQQKSMQRLVALKVSRGKGDEPQALAQFDHPNIVRVYDQRHVVDQQVHLLYMQFLPGGTLSDVVKAVRGTSTSRLGRVLLETIDRNLLIAAQIAPERSAVRQWLKSAEWPTVVAWVGVQLARALDDAHRREVLHRDVKPANVLLSAEGIPKLADFNVSFAGAAGRAGAAVCFGGSVGYMAPEHLRAIRANGFESPSEVKEPADYYALGILLWELWQGKRPFPCEGRPISWESLVDQQLESRRQPLIEPKRTGDATERVLEKTLRLALAYDPDQRPQSGAEMAGRLRLALHPKTATIFDPDDHSLASKLATLSPWMLWTLTGLVILLPHVAAGIFNFKYNANEVDLTPSMQESLGNVAWWVNSVAYPFAVILVLWFARGLARGVRNAQEGHPVDPQDVHETLELGHRAAVVGGTCWAIAGLIYPTALSWMHPDFTISQTIHFFVSLLICGGVAMIYPFFGLALVATFAYYPRLIRGTMEDAEFDSRAATMRDRCEKYLLGAAIIPLMGAALISENSSRAFMLSAIGAGVIGLLAAWFANKWIGETWTRMGEILSKESPVVPGESDGTDDSLF